MKLACKEVKTKYNDAQEKANLLNIFFFEKLALPPPDLNPHWFSGSFVHVKYPTIDWPSIQPPVDTYAPANQSRIAFCKSAHHK